MALSMEEQRILAEMERNLAANDPRLASRLSSFGQQRMPGTLKSQRVRTIAGLLALAMIAAVTVTMFMLSPYVNARHNDVPRARPTAAAPTSTTRRAPTTTGATIGAAKATGKGSTSSKANAAKTDPNKTGATH